MGLCGSTAGPDVRSSLRGSVRVFVCGSGAAPPSSTGLSLDAPRQSDSSSSPLLRLDATFLWFSLRSRSSAPACSVVLFQSSAALITGSKASTPPPPSTASLHPQRATPTKSLCFPGWLKGVKGAPAGVTFPPQSRLSSGSPLHMQLFPLKAPAKTRHMVTGHLKNRYQPLSYR